MLLQLRDLDLDVERLDDLACCECDARRADNRCHSREDPTDPLGIDIEIADYLYRESLMKLPKSMQRFLRRTAVLDQLCAPLCDALLEESDSQQRLRSLESLSLFVIPLDGRRQWYRYHALFREFLLGELRRVEPQVIMKLHRRAADWYESNGSQAMAIEHLLMTTERDRCVELVAKMVLPTYSAGQISTVQRWLSALGDTAIEQYPPLIVLAGWITALTGQTRPLTMAVLRDDAVDLSERVASVPEL